MNLSPVLLLRTLLQNWRRFFYYLKVNKKIFETRQSGSVKNVKNLIKTLLKNRCVWKYTIMCEIPRCTACRTTNLRAAFPGAEINNTCGNLDRSRRKTAVGPRKRKTLKFISHSFGLTYVIVRSSTHGAAFAFDTLPTIFSHRDAHVSRKLEAGRMA